jgi:hypothetical protein
MDMPTEYASTARLFAMGGNPLRIVGQLSEVLLQVIVLLLFVRSHRNGGTFAVFGRLVSILFRREHSLFFLAGEAGGAKHFCHCIRSSSASCHSRTFELALLRYPLIRLTSALDAVLKFAFAFRQLSQNLVGSRNRIPQRYHSAEMDHESYAIAMANAWI